MANASSFAELFRRVRKGDQDAARELVERYEPAIRRAVHFRLVDSRLARAFDSMDICQSVLAGFFVRAAAGQFDIAQPEDLLKLLVAMARNKVAQAARAQQRQRRDYRRIQDVRIEDVRPAVTDPSPSVQVAGQELLEKAARLMSSEERQIVALRQEGMDWDAIAAKLGGTPDALRKRLARAADRVAHQLQLDTFSGEA
jgi:RNA polymerase sigma-70 factor (ECF subfamily)